MGKAWGIFMGLIPYPKYYLSLDKTMVDLNTQAMIKAIEKYP